MRDTGYSTDVVSKNRTTDFKDQLEAELEDAKLLHRLSIEMIQEDGIAGLYEKIVQAALAIMRSQFATIQMLYPHDDGIGKLRILASSGFTPDAEKYWEWIYPDTGSTCSEVLRTGKRVIVPDYRDCDFIKGKPSLQAFLDGGILAAQSTPLFSRTGKLLGMITTHWTYTYAPPQAHLDLLDILARQASDLIERTQTAQALKESEERLRTVMARLETMVDERTRELQRSNEDLQQFAHVASHDLKEPVRKIRTYALRLLNELGNDSPAGTKLYTEKILESAGRMTTMIDGVLAYSSLNALQQANTTVNLNRIISEICLDLEMLIEQKNAVIECDELPVIDAVEVLIYQLFYNLINNSLKFSKSAEAPVIKISAEQFTKDNQNWCRLTVADNGIGFESIYNESIFDPFARLNSKTSYDGTGLGLSLSKKIIERHGGSIEAKGSKDEGAVFTILLPVA